MSIVIGEVVANIVGDVNRFSRDINDARRMGSNFATEIGSMTQAAGRSITNLGSTFTRYVTLPLAAAGVAVFTLGKDFEAEMSHITGLVGVASDQVNSWGKEILDLAPKLGKAPKELASALYYITSSGLSGAAAMDALTQSTKASTAGLGETMDVANLVTSAMNAYKSANLTAAQATDILTMAVREGKADAPEMAKALGQVLPIASTMNVSFAEVAGSVAVLTRNGLDAAEATTQVKAVLSGLINPSKGAEDALNEMGTSSAKLRKQIKEEGLLATLDELNRLTKKYGDDALADVFPNIRAFSGALGLANLNTEENKRIIDACTNSVGTLDSAYKAATETLDFKWNQMLGKAQSFAIGFFDTMKSRLIPVFNIVIEVLDKVMEKFQNLSPAIQNIILVVAGMAALIGPALLVIGAIITGIGATITALGTIISIVSAIISSTFLPVIIVIGVAIGIVIGIIGGLIASFIYLWKTNDEFRTNVLATWEIIKANAIIIFNEIKKTVSQVITGMTIFWKEHGDEITKFLNVTWNTILVIIRFAIESLKNIITFWLAVIRGDWGAAWDAIKAQLSYIWNGILNTLSNWLDGMKRIASSMFEKIKSTIIDIMDIDLSDAGRKIIQTLINGIKGMINLVGKTAADIAQKIRDKFPFSPAKDGPLKDLDNVDFHSSLIKALNLARSKINIPSLNIADDILRNITPDANLNLGFGKTGTTTGGINLYNPTFNGVTDMFDFMKQMQSTVQRYTGRKYS